MTIADSQREARKPSTPFFDAYMKRIGYYPRLANGKKLPKAVGIILEETGRKVFWIPKPGWIDGCLTNPAAYNEWIESVNY
jgi:hypothetical protein